MKHPGIDQLLERHKDPQDQEKIKEWDRQYQMASMIKDVGNHEGHKMIMSRTKELIEGINNVLNRQYELPEADRKALFKQREAYEWYLSMFDDAESIMEQIDKEIASNLGVY